MYLLGHVTQTETPMLAAIFALGLFCGLVGGFGLARFLGIRRK